MGGPGGQGEPIGEAASAQFTNGGFETPANAPANTVPPAPWTVATHLNSTGITVQTPQTIAGLNWATGGTAKTFILSTTMGAGSQSDGDLGTTASFRWPKYGNQCAIVNQHGSQRNVNVLTQPMTIGAGDVDSADGQVHMRFVVAPVLQNPAHTAVNQPYYMVVLTDTTKGTTLYSDFNLSGAGIPWKTINGGTANEIDYTDWQLVDIVPGSAVAMGDTVQLQLIAAGCQQSGHWGELYVDGVGATLPGLTIQGTGSAQANAGGQIVYTFTYRNGASTAETGVTIDFTTPANTTFSSINFPGATCTGLTAGGTGTETCTLPGSFAAGASGTFTLTVNVTACPASGPITCANYDIYSAQETTLIGTPINTKCGCAADADCAAGKWCNETAAACTATVANGSPVPTDPKHTAPTLTGTCTTAAATLTCTSGVCDTADNDCGYKNGDGTCSSATASKVCRSGVCDADTKCGYANGDGPCTPGATGNGTTVCRSGFCGSNGLCATLGACFVDSDCTTGNWCNETAHVCTPKVTNGTQVPSDPAHSNPTLNGTCTAADGPVGATVCLSGVCDANDGKCGYAVGDGPCTAGATGNGPTVCRSGVCSTNLTCEPLGGCNVDADCTGGNWCMESTHTCTPKLANGTAMPTDTPHTSPVLNGKCTSASGLLVCQSGVCDSDDKCGFLNGDGPCSAGAGAAVCRSGACDPDLHCGYAVGDGPCLPGPTGNGPVVCRSTACSSNGDCEPLNGCNVDADCTGGNWCMESTHTCTAKIPNGVQVPSDSPHSNPTLNGTCTAADGPVGALVCQSGVCDANDGKCGFAVGDGPCTPGPTGNGATVCRSGACSANLTCEPLNGCNVDADCTGGMWCNESAHMCVAQLDNGTPIPTDTPHANPTLNGTCTADAGLLVCVSGVCDTNDNKCGFAVGDGPCDNGNAGTVCRSGACSQNLTCEPAGGCNIDTDCDTGNWCNETTHVCTSQVANGSPVPTDGAHQSPTLNGTCTPAAGILTCQSGVCDTHDNECGYANGDGPCDAINGGEVCRSGMCSAAGVCVASGGCAADADCPTGKWCNESSNTCVPTVDNGMAVPSDPSHSSPTLNGTCTTAAGALTCTSGVCDTKDNECGYANGDGPCTTANGDSVCRSQKCSTTSGVCVGCTMNSDCSGATPVCNTSTGNCVQCTSSAQCGGATPICNTSTSSCVACNGDNGSSSTEPCPTATNPFCFLTGTSMAGQCGKCATNNDCTGHMGNICNTSSGVCVVGCQVDSDCMTGDWCNSPDGVIVGMCQPKIANGQPLPSMPTSVSTCSAAVGTRVCQSGVCDKDNECGLADGDGPCTDPDVCRSDMCNTKTMLCGGTPQCTTDADCPSGDFCKMGSGTGGGSTTGNSCVPKLPIGQTCSAASQCQSNDCSNNVCSGVIGSGNGLICATGQPGGSNGGAPAGLLGLAIAAAAVARRRRHD